MSLPQSEIIPGRTYRGHGWRTPRKVVSIDTEPGAWGATFVTYTSTEAKPRRGKKLLCHFAFEAIGAEDPTVDADQTPGATAGS